MESPEVTAGSYSGLSPLMSSILELTREIENLDEEPLVQRPRKVLWAKKRFPRQGIRCKGPSASKRRKYIRATAKDFPSSISNNCTVTSPVPHPAVPPLVSETFRREGSAETNHGTESSASDPDRSARTQNQNDIENLNGSNNDCNVYDLGNGAIGDEIHPEKLDANTNADGDRWDHEATSRDDDGSSGRAINVSGEEDEDSVYSSYSTRNDEISIAYHADSTVSYQGGVNYDVESENFDHANTGFEVNDDPFGEDEEYIVLSTTEESNTRSTRRIPRKVRALRRKTKADCENFVVAGPSSQDSGSVSRRSSRKTRSRINITMARGSEVCQGGKQCFACTDPQTAKRATSASIERSPRSLAVAPQPEESWTKKEWDDFFCLFSAVAAEAHTLQSLGSDNMVANKRWLGCMRTLLQKPPF